MSKPESGGGRIDWYAAVVAFLFALAVMAAGFGIRLGGLGRNKE